MAVKDGKTNVCAKMRSIHVDFFAMEEAKISNGDLLGVRSRAQAQDISGICNPIVDRVDMERNARSGPSIPFASLFDALGMSLADEGAVLILYSLIHGNADFLEYVLVRTDLETMLIPLLEILYNASCKWEIQSNLYGADGSSFLY